MKSKLVFALMLSAALTASGKKPPKPPNPVLCAIKTVFITGNNSAAVDLRLRWPRVTGMRLVNQVADADAILDVAETVNVTPRRVWGGSEKVYTVSVIFTDKSGAHLWSHGETAESVRNDPLVPNMYIVDNFNKVASCGTRVYPDGGNAQNGSK